MQRVPPRFAADVAQPLVVVTNWGPFGAVLLAVLLTALAAAAFAYLSMLRRDGAVALPLLIAMVAIAIAAAWCAPVLFSSDVYAYAAYGELARLGADPYVNAVMDRRNPLLAAADWQWSGALPLCVYGPAFVGLTRAVVAALAPLGTLAQLDGMRALASAALLSCAPLAYAAVPGTRRAKLYAAAAIAANPAAIWCAAEGHNDPIAVAVVLAGFAVARRDLWAIGGAIVAFSSAIKLPGALAAIAFGAAQRRARRGAAVGLTLAAALSIPMFVGVATRLAPHGRYAAYASLQGLVAPLGEAVALAVAALVAALIAVNGVRRLRRGSTGGWLRLGIAAWVLIPNPYPWYGLWLVALALTAPRTRAAGVAIALSFSSLLRYVPDAVGAPSPAAAIALGVAATLPLLWLFAGGDHDQTR